MLNVPANLSGIRWSSEPILEQGRHLRKDGINSSDNVLELDVLGVLQLVNSFVELVPPRLHKSLEAFLVNQLIELGLTVLIRCELLQQALDLIRCLLDVLPCLPERSVELCLGLLELLGAVCNYAPPPADELRANP